MTRPRPLPFIFVFVLFGCIGATHDFTIRFADVQGLQKGAPVMFEETVIGEVAEVEYTDEGRFLVGVAIQKEFTDAATGASRFYVDAAPGAPRDKVVRVVQLEAGGAPIEEGTVVDGHTKYAVVYEQFAHQLGRNLQIMESELNAFLTGLQDFSESEQIERLERQLDAIIADLGEMSVEMRRVLETEILPLLKRKIEALREQLEKSGEEEKLDPIDRRMDVITDRVQA